MVHLTGKIRNRIQKHKQEYILGLVILILPFLVFAIAIIAHSQSHQSVVKKSLPAVEQSFSQEMQTALEKTKQAVAEKTIDKYIASNDLTATADILRELAKKYGLTTMVAVNKEGAALARVPSPRKGDYVFQTTPWGRRAAMGEAVVTVGEGRNFPLIINSAVPITDNATVKGALFGGFILDNDYAQSFQRKYLKSGEYIAFYSKKSGIYGMSFEDSEVQRLLKIYVSEGSDTIQQRQLGRLEGHYRIGGKIYHAVNVKLSGLEEDVGGIILFVPVNPLLTNFLILLVSLVLLGLLILLIVWIYQSHKLDLFRYATAIGVLIFIAVGSLVAYAWLINRSLNNIKNPPYVIYNSTMEFVPEADLFQLNLPQRVAIQITSGGEVVNAAQASIKFDPLFIRVEDVFFTNSFCDPGFVIEKDIDNEKGSVTIACGKLSGLVFDKTVLAELFIQPLRPGKTELQFLEGTQVLAHDGLGTDVLRKTTNASYRVVLPNSRDHDSDLLLFSYSHPNETSWYNKREIHIDWVESNGYKEFAYAFDQTPNTKPENLKTDGHSIDLTAEHDGIYYFHLAPLVADRIGPVSDYKILVDTTPPKAPIIKASANTVRPGELVRFEFMNQGEDMSGLQKNFYVKFDGGIWLPTLPQLYVPFDQKGNQTITLRVFDNAGNFSDAQTQINVK